MPTRLLYADATFRLCCDEALLVLVWRDAPTVMQLQTFMVRARTHQVQLGDRDLVVANLVLSGKPRFSAEVRDETARAVGYQRTLATAHIVELPGLAGVAVHSFFSTALLLARPRAPHKVFSGRAPAVRWLLPFLRGLGDWSEARLLGDLDEAQDLAQAAAAPPR